MFSRKISITNYEMAFQKKMHPPSSSASNKMDEFKRDTISALLANVSLDDPVPTDNAQGRHPRQPPPMCHTKRTTAKPETKKDSAASNVHKGPFSTNRKLSPKIASTISALLAKAEDSTGPAKEERPQAQSPPKLETTNSKASSIAVQEVTAESGPSSANSITAHDEDQPLPEAPEAFLLSLQLDSSSGDTANDQHKEPELLLVKPVLQIDLRSRGPHGATVTYKAEGADYPQTEYVASSSYTTLSTGSKGTRLATSHYDATGPKPILRISLGAKPQPKDVPTHSNRKARDLESSPASPSKEEEDTHEAEKLEDDTEDVETVEEIVRALWRKDKPFWIRDLVAIMG
ncbi:hypothetical protein QBC37DRAFT_404793 [Rhypophila decipiens]|uniref:Uncharacterized protein n=1 Tax=Rhypophila decipiens TaxID=261697 RepID=A0AAN6XYL0_9PEZI|nr:hypothetical protein QBC37DRAFT_404793 [Rhypophila decipiens]